MANPSTIWAQLSIPNPAGGSIPYVYNDNITIVTDVANFSYEAGALGNNQLNLAQPIQMAYASNTTAGSTVTNNSPSGRVILLAANKILTVMNSFVTAKSIVLVTKETIDATGLYVAAVVPAAGSFVVTLNANTTGAVTFSYVAVNQ